MLPELEQKLDALPASPGVYLFKGRAGEMLYIGKARSLKSRVRSYFQASTSDTRFFISFLSRELGDIETVVVATEKEAALLENTLIKQHQPRYNVKLRDDKEYLSLRLDPKAKWPRLEVVRRPERDGALYFGPYHSATSARSTLRLVNRHFQLRTCTDTELDARRRPCLQFQIKRCLAPCVHEVDGTRYGEQVEGVAMFLDGRHDELIQALQGRMKEAAGEQAYERAAEYRDQLRAIERVREQNRVAVIENKDQDVFGLFHRADLAEVAVLQVRAGKLTSVRTFALRDARLPDDELMSQFLSEYYGPGTFIPSELLLPVEIEAMEGLEELYSEVKGRSVKVLVPKKGPRAELVQMARDNASHAFTEKARAKEDLEARLGLVQQKLRLPKLPRHIECVDVSHTGGTDTVACVVSLRDGQPDKRGYKSFHVKRVSGGDDYGAMYEVLSRRLKRGREGENGWELPDLLVVDGGRGQLNVASRVLQDLGMDLPVAGLAKEKANVLGEKLVDRIYLPGQKNPIELRESHAALSMLAVARDEAHRASNALRLKVGKKKRLSSRLDEVRGIGAKTRARLLRAFGSVRAVEEADEAALRSAGATVAQARSIISALHGPKSPEAVVKPAPGEVVRAIEQEDDAFVHSEDWAVSNAFDERAPDSSETDHLGEAIEDELNVEAIDSRNVSDAQDASDSDARELQ
jgi:excinuclease ABC subunit C